ncbi:MAG: DUF4846 domain-containing protein [Bergeyella sp.]
MLKEFRVIIRLFLAGLFFFPAELFSQVTEIVEELNINPNTSTIRTRIKPPKGYTWIVEDPGSFGDFLVNFPLYPENFPIRDFRQIPIQKQYNHAAVLNVDVGEKDLQQCADAWMRLYAEYLWAKKDFDKIVFEFTSGQKLSWNDYKSGIRTTEAGEMVTFRKSAKADDSYANFRNYLNLVFNYAGTISLDRESVSVLKDKDIRTGDLIITPGSPGHSVFIVGRAKNYAGKMVCLLAESFMPAQDIHIIINPLNKLISPWYELRTSAVSIRTPRYIFKPVSIKRYYQLVE